MFLFSILYNQFKLKIKISLLSIVYIFNINTLIHLLHYFYTPLTDQLSYSKYNKDFLINK